jgi:hypothetical protein
MDGIKRIIRLVMDPKATRDLEKDAREALDKGTDPKTPKKNLSAVEQGFARLKKAAIALGGAIIAAFTVRAIGRFVTASLRAGNELRTSRELLRQTVENEGNAWENVRYQIDEVTAALQRTHSLTEGEVNPILRTLISVTGDYENSLKAVGLAADLAAAKNMDQVTAARLLGRVLNGDITVLQRYGVEIGTGSDAIAVLASSLENMAKTAKPATQVLADAFQDFKEALGEALIEASDGDSILDALTQAVRSLTRFVVDNMETWRLWGTRLISAARSAFRFFVDSVQSVRIRFLELRISLLQARRGFNQLWASISPVPSVRRKARQAIQEITEDIERLNDALRVMQTPRARAESIIPDTVDLGLPEIRPRGAGTGERRGIPGINVPGLLGLDKPELEAERIRRFAASLTPIVTEATSQMLSPFTRARDEFLAAQREALLHSQAMAESIAESLTRPFEDFFHAMAMGFKETGSMMDGFVEGLKGFGRSVAAELADGQAELQIAEGTAKLASGTWPPNPVAIRAATQHFVAAGLFRAIAGVSRSGFGGRGSGGAVPTRQIDTRLGSVQRQTPEINIYIDPLNPTNPAWQSNLAQTLRGVTQRYGSATVNVRPRTA